MKGFVVVAGLSCAVILGAVGCGDDGSTGGGGTGGEGGSSGGGGSGTTSSSSTGSTSSTSSTSSTTSVPPGPCDGVIEGFVPEWKPSEGLHQGLCTDAQLDEFLAACIGPAPSEAACDAFVDASAENAACAMCAVSAPEDPMYGPMTIYEMPVVLYENPGQCVSEIEMDPTEESCGARIHATIQCSIAACAQCEYGGDFQVLLDCFAAAEAGSCKTFADERTACIQELKTQGAPIETCLYEGGNFYVYLKGISLLACGP